MSGEVYTPVEAFNTAVVIAKDLQAVQNVSILIELFTDSREVFGSVTKDRKLTEKSPMLEILAIYEAHCRFEFRSIDLYSEDRNSSDSPSEFNRNRV